MCFSATASFTAGGVLLAIGTITVSRVQKPTELLFAMIPLLFGIQQLLEGALWLTFPDKAPHLNTVLTYAYSAFSHVLWPLFVPCAVLLIEPFGRRRKVIMGTVAAGGLVSLYLLYALFTQPITASVEGRHITYVSPHFYSFAVMGLYLLGTCVSALLSSHKFVQLFGVAALASFIAAYVFYAAWFISVWCFLAAVMSGFIVLHFFRRTDAPKSNANRGALAG